MTFLKKLGGLLLKGALRIEGLEGLLPSSLKSTAGVIINDLKQIASIIVTVEAMGQALEIKGPDKLKAAAPLVAQVFLQSEMLAHRKVANEALFKQGAAKVADGVADILNALDDDIDTHTV